MYPANESPNKMGPPDEVPVEDEGPAENGLFTNGDVGDVTI